MNEIKKLEEKIGLFDKELITVTEKLEEIDAVVRNNEELQVEVKGIKIFLSRQYPQFKQEFPDIVKKVSKRD